MTQNDRQAYAELLELIDALAEASGKWIVSYEGLPKGLDTSEYHVREYETTYSGSARDGGDCKGATERLVMNYDPDNTATFVGAKQTQIKISRS